MRHDVGYIQERCRLRWRPSTTMTSGSNHNIRAAPTRGVDHILAQLIDQPTERGHPFSVELEMLGNAISVD